MSVPVQEKLDKLPEEIVPCIYYYLLGDMKKKLPPEVYQVKLEEAVDRVLWRLDEVKGKKCDELEEFFEGLKKELFPGALQMYISREFHIPKEVVKEIVDWIADKLGGVEQVILRNGYEGVIVRSGDKRVAVVFKYNNKRMDNFDEVYKDFDKVVLVRPRKYTMGRAVFSLVDVVQKTKKKMAEVKLSVDEMVALWVASAGTPMRGDLMSRYINVAETVAERIRKAVYEDYDEGVLS